MVNGVGGVLVVDDEFLIVDLLSAMLEDMGMAVCGTADTADGAIALAGQYRPRLVLMDVRLKGPRDGVDAAVAIHDTVGCPIIFITGSREEAMIERIKAHHPAPVLFKPIRFDQFKKAVLGAII
jgi:DNA-binding NarL/FixJ family response regulator